MFTNEYFSDRVSTWTRGEGGQPNTGSCRQEDGGSKSLKMCKHPLWMAPKLDRMIALNNAQLLVEAKFTKKMFWGPNVGQSDQNLAQN